MSVYHVGQRRGYKYAPKKMAQLEFDVVADSASEAAAAVPYQFGASYPGDGFLYASIPQASFVGNKLFLVTVDFQPAANLGGFNVPLQLGMWDVQFQPGVTTEPYGIDELGWAVINSAGAPYSSPPTKPVPTQFLIFTRVERFSIANANRYRLTVNDGPLTLFTGAGGEALQAGELLVTSIQPQQSWRMRSLSDELPLIPVSYILEIRVGGFYDLILDQGDQGWWLDQQTTSSGNTSAGVAKPGPFYLGRDRATNVKLDGYGKPLSDKFTVTKANKAAIKNPNVPDSNSNQDYDKRLVKITKPEPAVFIQFAKYRATNLSGLLA